MLWLSLRKGPSVSFILDIDGSAGDVGLKSERRSDEDQIIRSSNTAIHPFPGLPRSENMQSDATKSRRCETLMWEFKCSFGPLSLRFINE